MIDNEITLESCELIGPCKTQPSQRGEDRCIYGTINECPRKTNPQFLTNHRMRISREFSVFGHSNNETPSPGIPSEKPIPRGKEHIVEFIRPRHPAVKESLRHACGGKIVRTPNERDPIAKRIHETAAPHGTKSVLVIRCESLPCGLSNKFEKLIVAKVHVGEVFIVEGRILPHP